jgi:SH3/ankyrin repeat-containing protein
MMALCWLQAAKNGHEAHVELLLMYQTNINAVNKTGPALPSVSPSLLVHPMRFGLGNTALHVCATWDQAKTAVVLLRRGASTTIKNRAGQAAADVAMMAGSIKVCCDDLRKLSYLSRHVPGGNGAAKL